MMAFQRNYVVSILRDGKPVREFNESGLRTCRIPFNSEYQVRIKNKTYRRAMVVVTIDGTDVLTGSRKFILGADSQMDLERFVDSLSEGRKFKFVSLEEGARTGQIQDPSSPSNGLVRVQIYPELETTVTLTTATTTSAIGGWLGQTKSVLRGCPSSGQDMLNNFYGAASGTAEGCNLTAPGLDDVLSRCMVNSANSVAGATAEGSYSDQQFSQGAGFATELVPVTLDIWIKAPAQEVPAVVNWKPLSADMDWQGKVSFTVKIKGGSIWIEDSKGKKVYTQFIGFEGDFVRIKTTDFEFANQFQRDCLSLSKDGFEIRAYAKNKVVCE
jgi:hypothetical protein